MNFPNFMDFFGYFLNLFGFIFYFNLILNNKNISVLRANVAVDTAEQAYMSPRCDVCTRHVVQCVCVCARVISGLNNH